MWAGMGGGICFLNLGASPEKIFERREGEAKREAEGERDRDREKGPELEPEQMGTRDRGAGSLGHVAGDGEAGGWGGEGTGTIRGAVGMREAPSLPQSLCRVPLSKRESIWETMKEKGLLGEFLRTPKHDPVQKYHFGNLSAVYEPLAFLDVSPDVLPGAPSLYRQSLRPGPGGVLHHLLCTLPSSPWGLSDWPEGLCVLGKYGSEVRASPSGVGYRAGVLSMEVWLGLRVPGSLQS